MKDYLYRHTQVALQLLVIACAIAIGAFVAHYNEKSAIRNIELHISDQEKRMYTLADITDRNGADEVVSSIIADCPRRSEYESQLAKLNVLPKKDLVTIQNLFESCGNFYAERKALMVATLARELENTKTFVDLLQLFDVKEAKQYRLEKWEELVRLEKERSSLLSEQTSIQEKIITLLISGSTPNNKDVRSLVEDAQQIGQILDVDNQRIDQIRDLLKV